MVLSWIPQNVASPRYYFKPVLENEITKQWLSTPFDPGQKPIDTVYFDLAMQHSRITKEGEPWGLHSIYLPTFINNSFACVLNLGHKVAYEKNKATLLSRQNVVLFGANAAMYEVSHFSDNTVTAMYVILDDYGAQHAHVYQFQKNWQGEIDFDHPLQVTVEIGLPYCQFCSFHASKSCTCPDDFLKRWMIQGRGLRLTSYSNFIDTMISKKSSRIRVFHAGNYGKLEYVREYHPPPRKVERVSAWDYVGPTMLRGVIPLDADLVKDSLNSFQQLLDRPISIGDTFTNWHTMAPIKTHLSLPEAINEFPDSVRQFFDFYQAPFSGDFKGIAIPHTGFETNVVELMTSTETQDEVHHVPATGSTPQDLSHFYKKTCSTDSFGHHHLSNSNTSVHAYEVGRKKRTNIHPPRAKIDETKFSDTAQVGPNPRDARIKMELPQNTTKNNQFNCPKCDSSFFRSSDLNRHYTMLHEPNKIYPCSYCNEKLSSRGNLLKHIKNVHEKVKKFECNLCGTKFHQRFNLRRHTQNVHNVEMT